ncbi:MAG: hypothetical protein DME90_03520, partial [Verrucomicrobia bacterium]
KALDSKSSVGKPTVGSNPTPSAKLFFRLVKPPPRSQINSWQTVAASRTEIKEEDSCLPRKPKKANGKDYEYERARP